MIDRSHALPLTRQAKSEPEQPLLPAPPGIGGRSGDHAPDRRAAFALPVRGQPDAARSAARLWRSVKYEEVYLRAYDSVGQARALLDRYLTFYNAKRPHSALGARTPDQAYFNHQPLARAA